MKIGLFFGCFDPIHIGHLAVANYVVENTDLDKIVFVPCALSLKKGNTITPLARRTEMIGLAIESNVKMGVTAVEGTLPHPQWSIETVDYLKSHHKGDEFVVVIGADNLREIELWFDFERFLRETSFYIVDRASDGEPMQQYIDKLCEKYKVKEIKLVQGSPLMNISSTLVRNERKKGHSISYYTTNVVENYISEVGLYKE